MEEKIINEFPFNFNPVNWKYNGVEYVPTVFVGLVDIANNRVAVNLRLNLTVKNTSSVNKTVDSSAVKVVLHGDLSDGNNSSEIDFPVSNDAIHLTTNNPIQSVDYSRRVSILRKEVPQSLFITLSTTNTGGATISGDFPMSIPPLKQNATNSGRRITCTVDGVKYDLLNYK